MFDTYLYLVSNGSPILDIYFVALQFDLLKVLVVRGAWLLLVERT